MVERQKVIRRGWVMSFLVLVIGATVGLAATVQYWWPTLPDPATATSDELLESLVQFDMRKQSEEFRRDVLVRLEVVLDEGVDWNSADEQLFSGQRDLLVQNLDALVYDWFTMKMKRFEELESKDRNAWLDLQLERVSEWGIFEYLAETTSSEKKPGLAGQLAVQPKWAVLIAMQHRAESWIEDAAGDVQEQRRKFLAAVQSRAIVRMWRGR